MIMNGADVVAHGDLNEILLLLILLCFSMAKRKLRDIILSVVWISIGTKIVLFPL